MRTGQDAVVRPAALGQAARVGYAPRGYHPVQTIHGEEERMTEALVVPLAVGTGVVVIVVAIAVVLVVLFATVSMRGRQRRGAKRRDETRRDLAAADERAERAQRDRDIAEEQAQQRNDRDR